MNDIVLVLYKTRVSEAYRIGKVDGICPNNRNLDLTVSPPQHGDSLILKTPSKMLVPIQRTILLYSPHDQKEEEEEQVGSETLSNIKEKCKDKDEQKHVSSQPAPNNLNVNENVKVKFQNEAPQINDLKRKRGRPAKDQTNPQQLRA